MMDNHAKKNVHRGLLIAICTIAVAVAAFFAVTYMIKTSELRNVQVGNYVYFGSYEQDNDISNGAEDIEWLVLDKQDNKILVISKYGLDAQPYNTERTDTTWERCPLRSWLNSYFYDTAFTTGEKHAIVRTTVSADENPEYPEFDNNPGNDTMDNVFLLSITEAENYFSSDRVCQCLPTDYAIAQGASANSAWLIGGGKTNCCWWLRTPGILLSTTAYVISDGSIACGGDFVNDDSVCARPALWVTLDAKAVSVSKQDNLYDSKAAASPAKKDLKAAKVGDYIYFGSYEQDNSSANGKEEIEWQVLDKQKNKILVISKYALDAKPYSTKTGDITWENCSLRTWLNNDFYDSAFNTTEKQAIMEVTVSAGKNPKYDTDPGNSTTDNVFLLSVTEAEKYLLSDHARQCTPTDYAIAQGAYTDSDYRVDGRAACFWWLRSPGEFQWSTVCVSIDSSINYCGSTYDRDYGCVRPVLWINLEA